MRKLNEQKYCGWCGGEVVYKAEWMSECTNCGYKRFLNHNPCSNIMLIKDGSVLMVTRAIEPQRGKLDFPGGFMDMADDSIETASLRELYEEIGLTKEQVGALTYHGSRTSTYIWMDSEVHNICFFFSCQLLVDESQIKLDQQENSSFRWVKKEDLPSIDFAWDIDRQMLEKYFEDKI